ncbi:MAG: hypothetical protein R6V58_03450 [Planctomycetota bacterium]
MALFWYTGADMLETARSKNGTGIRLTDERWAHITEEHAELAGRRTEVLETVENPDRIVAGNAGELLALRFLTGRLHVVAVYREFDDDGFIITAFLTSKLRSFERREQLWP